MLDGAIVLDLTAAVPLKSRSQFPPGSWMFFQPETGWSANQHVGFNEVVTQIIEHRKANPRFNLSTDREKVAQELESYTEARLRSQYGQGADQWLINSSSSPPPSFTPHLRSRLAGGVVAVADKAKKFTAGVGLILDWLGDKMEPVDQVTADSRAIICADCKFNREPKGVQSLYATAANNLHELMEAKNGMSLRTSLDERLRTCEKCDCKLDLKVWAPADHVRKHTDEKLRAELPDYCWVKSA